MLHITLFSKGENCRCCLNLVAGQIQPEQFSLLGWPRMSFSSSLIIWRAITFNVRKINLVRFKIAVVICAVVLTLYLSCLMDAAQLNHLGSVTKIVSKISSAWSKQ